MPRKVRFVRVTVIDRRARAGERRPLSHLVALDSDGRLWERYSDMPLGDWGLVKPPDYAGSQSKGRVRKR